MSEGVRRYSKEFVMQHCLTCAENAGLTLPEYLVDASSYDAVVKRLEGVEAAINDEPELEGPIPEEMYEALQGDPELCAETLRIVVRKTKAGILERLKREPKGEGV